MSHVLFALLVCDNKSDIHSVSVAEGVHVLCAWVLAWGVGIELFTVKGCCDLRTVGVLCVYTREIKLSPFHSASGGNPGHLGERTAGAADRTRRLQAQGYLCVCTNGQRQDSCICHTCRTGELPTITFEQEIHNNM